MSKSKNEKSMPIDDEKQKCCCEKAQAGEEQNNDCGCCQEKNSEDLAQKYLQLAQSVQADFENFKKRNANAVSNAYEDGKKSVILSILPCVDAVLSACEMIKDEQTQKGLQMVSNKFDEVLKGLGVQKIECLGKMYDANLHNVLAQIESKSSSGEIVQVCMDGYIVDGIVLRHAQVVVAK